MAWRTLAVATVLVAAMVLPGRGQAAPPVAQTAACQALGAADRFAVFSDGPFTATTGGTLNGGVRYGDSLDLGPGFQVNGERTQCIRRPPAGRTARLS